MYEIEELIPQRAPIKMVEAYEYGDENHGSSWLTMEEGNIFLTERGTMSAEGLLEHIAQTAAAHIGYRKKQAGEDVTDGYIGDIKKCSIDGQMPKSGDRIRTEIRVISQVGNITLIEAETFCGEKRIIYSRMKLAS